MLVIIIIVMLVFFKIIDALVAIISPEMSVYFAEIIPFLILAVIMIYMLRKFDKKKSAVIIVIVTAVIFAVNMIDYYVIKRDWIVTTATITGVNRECGGLCGSYMDENGKWQRQGFDSAAVFCRSVLMSFPYGYSCYDRLRGMQVLIYYDPNSVFWTNYYEIYLNKSKLYLFVKMNIYLSAISLLVALVYLIIVKKQIRKYVEKET